MIERFYYPFVRLRKDEYKILDQSHARAQMQWVDDDSAQPTEHLLYSQKTRGWMLTINALSLVTFRFVEGSFGLSHRRVEWDWIGTTTGVNGKIQDRAVASIAEGEIDLHAAQMLDAMLPRLLERVEDAFRKLPAAQRRHLKWLAKRARRESVA